MAKTEKERMKTTLGWKIVGVAWLVPGLLALTILDIQAGRHVQRALRRAWEDWYWAFFADPKPGIRVQRKPPRSA